MDEWIKKIWLVGIYTWLSGKETTCQCRSCKSDPWIWKIPWRKKWQPSSVFLPGKSQGQRSPEGYSAQGRRVRHDLVTKQQQQKKQQNRQECFSSIKKKEILPFAKWMAIILIEISQRMTSTLQSYMWSLRKIKHIKENWVHRYRGWAGGYQRLGIGVCWVWAKSTNFQL